jgi:hypothetical protein
MTITDTDKNLLLDFQRAKFAYNAFSTLDEVRSAYEKAVEALKQIKEPAIAELVRRMSQEWLTDEKYVRGRLVSRSMNIERGEDILLAEKELYELSFQFGDNTPSETDKIQ